MRIGELARRGGVPATTLRYYEKSGLLQPPRRTVAGYRAYDEGALSRLAFIRAAQGIGLTLAEIRDVISIRAGGQAPCQHVVQLIAQRRAEVRSRIRELRELERDLGRLAKLGDHIDLSDCDPSGICAVIPSH